MATKQVKESAARATAPAAESYKIVLHVPDGGKPLEIIADASLKRDAMHWSNVVRSRARWSGKDPVSGETPLARLIDEAGLKRIAAAGLVEVEIPYVGEHRRWEARVFPWEYLLSRATKPFRASVKLAVVRRLNCRKGVDAAQPVSLARIATVEASPGGLDKWYDVRLEGNLMLDSLVEDSAHCRRVVNPTPHELGEQLAVYGPTLVHVAGVDTHQAIELLGIDIRASLEEDSAHVDGLALRDRSGSAPAFVQAESLARLVAGAAKPDLVFYNFYNSASRIAALTVAHGARYAIGYHDTIDDALAVAFATTFYRTLKTNGGVVLPAFRAALDALRAEPERLQGACMVLWSAEPIVARGAAKIGSAPSVALPEASSVAEHERIGVLCKPRSEINYSLLHNGHSPFDIFEVFRRNVSGPIRNIRAEVTLHVGESSLPFQSTVELTPSEARKDLRASVVVPLTSVMLRTQSERLLSCMVVRVDCDGKPVWHNTYPVSLNPVDEWKDDPEIWRWLPSFVMPRDPAVARIIDSAQRYLMALADDPGAGFDGYQSIDESGETLQEKYGCVDLQVRALWSALLYEHGLSYINPPPSYAKSGQRIRSPSQILKERRGTCIDLALLLAACLEYVDIYPVVVLLKGHAFPGYWRSAERHDTVARLGAAPAPEAQNIDEGMLPRSATDRSGAPHVLDSSDYGEVRTLVMDGDIVPLETVWLTNHGSFGAAVEEGGRNLRSRAEFESLIDIKAGRDSGVTPLPMIWTTP